MNSKEKPSTQSDQQNPQNIDQQDHVWFYGSLAITFGIRLWFAFQADSFTIDTNSFRAWAGNAIENGFANFYGTTWCDYPPFYLYVLWAVGWLIRGLHALFPQAGETIDLVCIKLPAMLADMGASLLIVQILRSRVSRKTAYLSGLAYAFNPALLFTSAIWGQIDGVLNLWLLGVLWLALEDYFLGAAIACSLGIILKPQGIFFVPIFFFSQWYRHSFWQWLGAIAASLIAIWLVTAPFVWQQLVTLQRTLQPGVSIVLYPFQFLYTRLQETVDYYNYASVNAFNPWTFANWVLDSTKVFGLVDYHAIGLGLLGILTAWLAVFLYQHRADGTRKDSTRKDSTLFFAAAVLFLGSFDLLTRMHERYSLYTMPFLVLAIADRPKLAFTYWTIAIAATWNAIAVYFIYMPPQIFDHIPTNIKNLAMYACAAANLSMLLVLLVQTMRWQTQPSTANDPVPPLC